MNQCQRPRPVVAAFAALSLLVNPHSAADSRRRGRRPRRPHSPPRRRPAPCGEDPARGREDAARPAEGAARRRRRRRMAALLQPAQRRQHPRLSAADLELGQAEAHGRVQRGLVPHRERRQARARHDQDRSRHPGRADRAARQLPEDEDRGSQLPDAAEGTGARDHRRRSKDDARRGPRHRARSRARQRGQERHRRRRTSRA